jgi:hypothetical protein
MSTKEIEIDLYTIAAKFAVQKSILNPVGHPADILRYLNRKQTTARTNEIASATGCQSSFGEAIVGLLLKGLVERVRKGVYQITSAGITECKALKGEAVGEYLHYKYNPCRHDELGLSIALKRGTVCTIPEHTLQEIKTFMNSPLSKAPLKTIFEFDDARKPVLRWRVTFSLGDIILNRTNLEVGEWDESFLTKKLLNCPVSKESEPITDEEFLNEQQP